MSKYGFGDGGIDLPDPARRPPSRPQVPGEALAKAVQAGSELGFVSRDPDVRLRPGPRRTEPQAKVSVPGPKRVIEDFRGFCRSRNMTLWQGLEYLLNAEKGRSR